jgi:hypothetical protein
MSNPASGLNQQSPHRNPTRVGPDRQLGGRTHAFQLRQVLAV